MKLIPLDALMAEIEKRKKEWSYGSSTEAKYKVEAYKELIEWLDTLEVKEVDLEKEIDKFYGIYRKNGKTYSIKDNEECVDWKVDCNPDFEIAFAKHFFELGMAVRQVFPMFYKTSRFEKEV